MSNRVTQIDPLHIQSQPLADAHRTSRHMIKRPQGTYSHSLAEKPKAVNAIQETQGQAVQLLAVIRESPWVKFRQCFSCRLAGFVTVAERIKDPTELVHIYGFSNRNKNNKAKRWLQVLRSTQHRNIISASEIYQEDGMTYFLVDDLPVTLENLAALPHFSSELQLASILKQVLDGICHLLESGFEHGELEGSNILVGQDGVVQIAALEHCSERQSRTSDVKSIKFLANIAMLLMQGYVKADGAIGVDNPHWQSDALEFVSATTSVTSVQDLRKCSLLTKHQCSAGSLVRLVRLALYTTRTYIPETWQP